MSVQPLRSTDAPAYTPPAANRASGDTSTIKQGAGPVASSNNTEVGATTTLQPTFAAEQESLKEATQRANEAVAGLRSDLKFAIDDETGINVVKFIDVKPQEVIRQIPAQEMLVIAKRLDELQGLLIKEKA